ncbi:S-layer homology domain-containing protein [Aneurinibacillus migulanus]|uniref:S-layer homology domain-containing protein n=1 Tax=Aneurinibacillus migulanus TaxID=47500 RepID=UPI000696BB5C|nr:S-layer homology domain-containing protein [Aneurinibacillus migulanus]
MFNKKMVGILAASAIAFNVVSVSADTVALKDIKNHWANTTIQWGVTNQIVTGYPDGTFKPDKFVTEAEFLTMLINAYERIQPKTVKHWADSYYDFSKTMNYPTRGMEELSARNWPITRQHVAEIIAGTQGSNYAGNDAIKFVLAKGLARGTDPNNVAVETFNAKGNLTRAEAVQFIKALKEKGLKELQTRPAQPSDPAQIPPLPQTPQPPVQSPTNGNVTVVPSSNPGFLLPKDTTTEPAVQAFIDSLKLENGNVTGKVPEIPSGHTMVLRYKDASDGKWGERKYDKDFTSLKPGETFSVGIVGQGGKILFDIYKNPNIGVNGAVVYIPSMKAEWGAKR